MFFLIDITALLSVFTAPFAALGGAAGSQLTARQQQQALLREAEIRSACAQQAKLSDQQ